MRIGVATSEGGGPFDGVFWNAYFEAGGVAPECVFLLADRHDRSLPVKLLESLLLFRLTEMLRLVGAREFGRPLTETDRELGLHLSLRDFLPAERFVRVESLNSEAGRRQLHEAELDVLVSIGAPEIFDNRILRIPRRQAVNLHNGRLPAFRGLFGTFWELYEGRARGYVTLHEMVPEVDAGEILVEESVEMEDGLFQVLIEKKTLGGQLLADFFSDPTASGRVHQRLRQDEHGYYSWPSLTHMWKLRRSR